MLTCCSPPTCPACHLPQVSAILRGSSSLPRALLAHPPCGLFLFIPCSFHKFGGNFFPGTGDIGNMGHGACVGAGAAQVLAAAAWQGAATWGTVRVLGCGGAGSRAPEGLLEREGGRRQPATP